MGAVINIKKSLTCALSILLIFSIFSTISIRGEDNKLIILGEISVNPQSCNLGPLPSGDTADFSFEIKDNNINNPESSIIYTDVEWSIEIPETFNNYITVSPSSGVVKPNQLNPKTGEIVYVQGNTCTVYGHLNTTGLGIGEYKCDIIIRYNIDSLKVFTIRFFIGAYLKYSPEKGNIELGKPDTGTFSFDIWNDGFGTMNYEFDITCKKINFFPFDYNVRLTTGYEDFRNDWVTINTNNGSSNGEKHTIILTIDTSTLELGYYLCIINISSNAVNNNGKGQINLFVTVGPRINFSFVEGDVFDFGSLRRGDIVSTTFQISNKHPGDLKWEILIPEEIQGYVTVSPMQGVSSGPDDKCNVTLTINTSAKIPNDVFPAYSRGKYVMKPGYFNEFIVIKSNDVTGFSFKSRDLMSNSRKYTGHRFDFQGYLSICNPDDSYDMVIIVADYLKSFPHSVKPKYSLEDLADLHRVKDGFNVTIKTVKEIYDDYRNYYMPQYIPYRTDLSVFPLRNSLEVSLCIREFLRDAYFHWDNGSQKQFYVLLVGDDDWNMIEKVSQEYSHYDGIPWDYYYKNLDTKWLKVGNPPPDGGELGNKMDMAPGYDKDFYYFSWGDDHYWNYSVEVPTFQIPVGGYSQPESGDSDDETAGWEKWFIPLTNGVTRFNISTATININTLFPYKDENGKLKNIYISSIEAYDENAIKQYGDICVIDESAEACDVVNLGTTDPALGEYTDDEIAHNARGWNLSVGSYKNKLCRSINYKDQGSGGSVTLNAENGRIMGITIEFYNHLESGFDTFIVRINGVEVARNLDGRSYTYMGGDPFTSASDLPYACLGTKYSPCLEVDPLDSVVTIMDTTPELIVGRAPVRTAVELENFVKKTIEYVNSPVTDEYLNAVVASEYLGYKSHRNWENRYLGHSWSNPSIPHGTPVFMCAWKNLTVDGATDVGFIDDDQGLPGGAYSNYNTVGIPSSKYNIIQLHDKWVFLNGWDYGAKVARLGWSGDDIVDLINNGVGLINHMGHAIRPKRDVDTLSGCSEYDEYRVLRLYNNLIEDHTIVDIYGNPIRKGGLKNTIYPVVFSLGCYGGQFDNPYTREIGETLIIDENGAVAGVFNAMMMPGDEYKETKYDRMFWHEIFGNGHIVIGDAFNAMKVDVGNIDSKLFYGLNLLGDPAIKIKGAEKIEPIPSVSPSVQSFGIMDFNLNKNITFEIYNQGTGKLIWDTNLPKYDLLLNPLTDSIESYLPKFYSHFITIHPIHGTSTGVNDKIYVNVNINIPSESECIKIIIEDILDYSRYKHGLGFTPNHSYLTNLTSTCISSYFEITFNIRSNNPRESSFTVVGNAMGPMVSNIPNQSINYGEEFTTIILDDYVTDPDTDDQDIIWTYYGNKNIRVNIINRNATITYPSNWTGSETITFTACDNTGLSDSTDVTFEVKNNVHNRKPVITMQYPMNGSIDVPVNISMLRVDINDPEGDFFDWSIKITGDIETGSYGIMENNGTKTCTIDTLLKYNTTYKWYVTAKDYGSNLSTDAVFSFKTVVDSNHEINESENKPPVITFINPANEQVNVSINKSSLTVKIEDPEGDSFDWSITTNPEIGFNYSSGDINGTKTCSISGLQYDTTYTWFINATDTGSGQWTRKTYTFKTEKDFNESVEPAICILKPLKKSLYIQNTLKKPFPLTFLIGGIEIEAKVIAPSDTLVQNITFYIDNEALTSFSYNQSKTTYSYTWDKRAIGLYSIKVVAYDGDRNEIASDELNAIVINFNIL